MIRPIILPMHSLEAIMNRAVRHHSSRRFVQLVLVCVLVPAAVWSAEPLRTYRDTNNRSFEGRLTAFDATDQIVSLRRVDGKIGRIPLSNFCEEDREYIRAWRIANDFMKAMRISVALNDAAPADVESHDAGSDSPVRDYYYLVQLENKSTSTFDKIRVEYCIFYRQGQRDGFRIRYAEGTCYGSSEIKSLASAFSHRFETKKVRLFADNGSVSIFGKIDDLTTDDIRGIWLRFKIKPAAGTELVREYRTSSDEKWKWTEYSIGAAGGEGSSGIQYILQ